MKLISYVFISTFALLAGALFTAIHYDWLIIRFPAQKTVVKQAPQKKSERKKVTLFFWRYEAWHTENTELVVSENTAQTAELLIQTWLTTLEEEGMTEKKISLQSVLVSPAGLAYVSLAKNPFSQDATTWEKLMWTQGLLKTMQANIKGIEQVQFMVAHKPLQDPHLDFTHPWPVTGWID